MADASPPLPPEDGGGEFEALKQARRRQHMFAVVIDVIRTETGLMLEEFDSNQAANEKVLRV